MTDKNNFADGSRRHATDVMKHRWPTILAIACAVLVAFDLEDGSSLYFILIISALGYLAAAALDLRWVPWAVLVLSIPAVVVMRILGIEPAVGLLVAAAVFLVLGLARWRRQATWGMPLQTSGMFAFAAIALAVLFIEPNLGAYLVAVGLFGHAAWDIVHYWANRVAARSFAEWCAVFDILLGAAVLFVLFTR